MDDWVEQKVKTLVLVGTAISLVFSCEVLAQLKKTSMTPVDLNQSPLIDHNLVAIEFKSTYLEAQQVTFRMLDDASKSQAFVTLNRTKADSRTWRGLYHVRFAKGAAPIEKLRFLDRKGRVLAQQMDLSATPKVIRIFANDQEMGAFLNLQSPSVPPLPTAGELRLGLEEKAARERASLVEKNQRLSPEQRRKNIDKAKMLGREAMELYKQGQFKSSSEKFAEASKLDPENLDYVYQQAICAYKLENYNESLALISMSDGAEVKPLERDYYVALNHMKLKDLERAYEEFVEIRDERDPEFSPMAAFFAGTLDFQNQRTQEARKNFEEVLDISQDPALDREAEVMLDEVDRLENFLAASREKFHYSFYLTPQYDSNVLNLSKENVSTDVAAYRLGYGAGIGGKFLRRQNWDMGLELNFSDTYSTKTDFKSDATIQAADAIELAAAFPVRIKNFNINPAQKYLYLSPTGGTRSVALITQMLSIDYSRALASSWIGRLTGEVAKDTSRLEVVSGDDSQTGTRFTMGTSLIKILDARGEKTLTTDLNYGEVQAQGINNKSKKPGAALTFGFSGFWKQPASAKLDYYQQNYGEATSPRTDKVWALNFSQNKKLSPTWSWSLGLTLTRSQSTSELYRYEKALLTSTWSHYKSVE